MGLCPIEFEVLGDPFAWFSSGQVRRISLGRSTIRHLCTPGTLTMLDTLCCTHTPFRKLLALLARVDTQSQIRKAERLDCGFVVLAMSAVILWNNSAISPPGAPTMNATKRHGRILE